MEAGALLSMKYTISTEAVMTWRYKIDSGDISFGIKRKKASQTSTSRYCIVTIKNLIDTTSYYRVFMYQTMKQENLPQIQIDEAGDSISSFEVLEEVDEPGEFYEDPFADQTDELAFKKVIIERRLPTFNCNICEGERYEGCPCWKASIESWVHLHGYI